MSREILFSLMFWKFPLCIWLGVQTILSYAKTGMRTNCSISSQMTNDGRSNDFLGASLFRTTDCLLFIAKLLSLERATDFCFETLPHDVFLCFAGFF